MNQNDAETMILPRRLDPLTLPPAINLPTDKEQLAWIYGLSDPRDGQLHVIGRTVRPEHVGVLDGLDISRTPLPDNPTPRQEWGIDLARDYRFAVKHLLACVPKDWAEDYKRLYVEAAREMGLHLLGHYLPPDWRMDRPTAHRILGEAMWVLTHAYANYDHVRPVVANARPPYYDDATLERLKRPGLLRYQWHEAKEDADHDAEYQAWLASNSGPLRRDRYESQEDYDYRIGLMQAAHLGIPVLEAQP